MAKLASIQTVGGMLGQMLDAENFAVDLFTHLHLIAAIDENNRALGEHDGKARRSGEAGQPGEPLGARRHVFVLKTIGARHNESVHPRSLSCARSAAMRGAVSLRSVRSSND